MTKKIFLFFLLCAMTVGAFAADGGNLITTCAEFVSAVRGGTNNDTKVCTANLVLGSDIDLTQCSSDDKAYLASLTFSGQISSYAKSGETVPEKIFTIGGTSFEDASGQTVTHYMTQPVFAGLNGAVLTNVAVGYFKVIDSGDKDDFGALARTMKGSTLTNVVLYDIRVHAGDDYAGSVAGEATNCRFINLRCANVDISADGNSVGGIVGYSSGCTFTDCMTSLNSKVFADGTLMVGALVGGMSGDSEDDSFTNCINFATVGADEDYVGGIAGRSDNDKFIMCVNSGWVLNADEDDFRKEADELYSSVISSSESFDLKEDIAMYTMVTGFGLVLGSPFLAYLSPVAMGVGIFVGFGLLIGDLIFMTTFELDGHDGLGGISGLTTHSVFDCCANYVDCIGVDLYTGGIAGKSESTFSSEGSKFYNCLNAGDIRCNNYAGGIVGWMEDAEVYNCLNVGNVRADNNSGALFAEEKKCSWNNNYFLNDRYDAVSGGRVGVTAEQLASGQVAWWLNNNGPVKGSATKPWRQDIGTEGDAFPLLDKDHKEITTDDLADRYIITTASELLAFASMVNGRSVTETTYIAYLGADINLDDTDLADGNGNWTPIGTQDKPFYGLFFGGGHMIDHLVCNVTHADAGIFGTIGSRTEIHDLILGPKSSVTSTKNAVGGIVGCVRVPDGNINTAKITGCGNQGTITGSYNVGGILGAVYKDTDMKLIMSDCYNAGQVHGTGIGESSSTAESAALCGYAKNNAQITNCWNLTLPGAVTGYEEGKFFVRLGAGCTVSNCYNIDLEPAQTGVTQYSSTEFTDGTLCYKLNGKNNNTSDGLRWEHMIGENSTGGYELLRYTGYGKSGRGVYHSRMVSNTYGTVVLPYDTESNDTVSFYVFSGASADNSQLNFEYVESLPAGTPALFKVSEKGKQHDFLSTSTGFNPTGVTDVRPDDLEWTMTGTMSLGGRKFDEKSTPKVSSVYYISGDKICNASKTATIAQFRAYLVGPDWSELTGSGAQKAPALSVTLDDGFTTAITLVRMDDGSYRNTDSSDSNIYNVAGQQLSVPAAGINIRDGKKFLYENE